MSRKPDRLRAALESDFDAVVRATDSYLKEHNLFKDYFALVREETQNYLFEHIDREIECQRTVCMELLREFWTLYYEATPYDEGTVRRIVDEHLETKRQHARAIVEHDLVRQEEYERVSRAGLPARLKWRADRIWRRVKNEWESSTSLEAGLTTAASIACLWYLAFFWWAPREALPMMGFLFGPFAGIFVGSIRGFQIENKRWQEWRMQLAKKR